MGNEVTFIIPTTKPDRPPRGAKARRLWIAEQADMLGIPAFMTPRWRSLYGRTRADIIEGEARVVRTTEARPISREDAALVRRYAPVLRQCAKEWRTIDPIMTQAIGKLIGRANAKAQQTDN